MYSIFYFREICSRVGSAPEKPGWAASSSTLGWSFILGYGYGMSPLSPMRANVFFDMRWTGKEMAQSDAEPQRTRDRKARVSPGHQPWLWIWIEAKLSTTVPA